jgi:hypothetical protein
MTIGQVGKACPAQLSYFSIMFSLLITLLHNTTFERTNPVKHFLMRFFQVFKNQ